MSDAAKRVVVVGASGLVGSRILARLGKTAVGTYHSRPAAGLHLLDVTEPDDVADFFDAMRPTAVVLAAAYTHVDGCERDPARSHDVNVVGARNVARAAAAHSARVVFLSSDYVFGSDDGPHRIDEAPRPLNQYGQHKLEAERVVRDEAERAGNGYAIIRSCNVYGYEPAGMNFVMAVYRNGEAGKTMRVPADQWGNPTYADDLVDAVAAAVARSDTGVFHAAGPDYVDRLTWAARAARAFGLEPGFIEGVATSALAQPARRPLKAGLDSRVSLGELGVSMRGVDEGIALVASALRRSA